MVSCTYPSIDLASTGENIMRLREAHGISMEELCLYCGFTGNRAIYKWKKGQCLPSVDNLMALSVLFGVPVNDIIVLKDDDVVPLSHETNHRRCIMKKDVPFRKLSKKAQKSRNAERRGSWGDVNPVTRRPAPAKAYCRAKARQWSKDDQCRAFEIVRFFRGSDLENFYQIGAICEEFSTISL